MNRTPQQRAAIDSDSLDILLSAGAGSGKTSTTVSRYERLLTGEYTDGRTGEPVDPEAILVFTFTDKAAGELRERIRNLRDSRGFSFSMGSLWVGTFHSICARILRGHPIAASIDPAFKVIDDVVASRLKESAYDQALNQVGQTEEVIELLSRFTHQTLKSGVQAAYERLRAAGELKPKLPAPDPGPSTEEIQLDLLREAGLAVSDPDLKPAPRKKAENVIAALRDVSPEQVDLQLLESIDIYKSSKQIPELCEKVAAAKTALLSREVGPLFLEAIGSLLDAYGEAYETAKAGRGGLDFEDLQLKTLDLLLRRPDIAEIYQEQFAEIMVDEFQDTNRLQMDLIDLLRSDSTRLFTVGDEMQAIYGFRYADVELFRQRRTGIGYRLPKEKKRRDDGERDEVRFAVEHLSLNANFRSQAPVIGAVNEIGRQFEALVEGIRTDDEPGGAIGGTRHEFEELRVGVIPDSEQNQAFEQSKVELLLVEAGTWQETDFGPLAPAPGPDQYVTEHRGEHEAEALALAWHAKGAIEDGVPPGDIVILLRTKSRMWLFEAALKQVGLHPYVVGGTGFWESREGVDLRALLATFANPRDDDALIGTLAGPACGLSPSALWLLAQNRRTNESIWPRLERLASSGFEGIGQEDQTLAASFVRVTNDLRARQSGISLAEFVTAAVAETGYDLVSLMRDPSGAGLANIRRVAEIAGEFEAAEGRDLRGLVSWIDDSSRLDSEQAIATEDEESDVIRLMTIHKSKGLEFPMVYVADLGRRSTSNSESLVWITPRLDQPGQFQVGLRLPEPEGKNLDLFAWPELNATARLETTDEELRILHVALTRAKERLVLSGVANLEEIPGGTEAASVATRLTQAFGLDDLEAGIVAPPPEAREGTGFTFSPSLIEVIVTRAEDAEGLEKILSPHEDSGESATTEGRPPLTRPETPPFPEVPLSYSALAVYDDCPARFYASRVLKLEPAGHAKPLPGEEESEAQSLDPEDRSQIRRDGTDFGTSVHRLLELMASRHWRLPTEDEIRGEFASEDSKLESDVTEATAMLSAFRESDLGKSLQGRPSETEASFLWEIDGVMLRGSIDLLVRDPEQPIILDYKTNKLGGGSPSDLMEKYGLQRDLYAIAVAKTLGSNTVEAVFSFLRDVDSPVRKVFDAEHIADAEDRISELVGDIAQGRYLGGEGATRKPCGSCWACDLLAERIESTRS